jgi:hypothetical protein
MMLGGVKPFVTTVTILSIKINSMSQNASVNIGESLHNRSSAPNKMTGLNASYGDQSPTTSNMKTVYIDPDVNDQSEIGCTDIVRSNQM